MDTLTQGARASFTLAGVRIEPDRNSFFGAGEPVRVEPKVMDVLVALAEADGDVVSRDALIARVWAVDFGGDESVTRAVSLLRKALKEAGLGEDAIETVSKRGYRLSIRPSPAAALAETTAPLAASASIADPSATARPGSRPMRTLLIVALAAVAVAGLAYIVHVRFFARGPEERPVVAVLPFDDLSPGSDHRWFAEGLADELIANLARAPGLAVIGRTRAFSSVTPISTRAQSASGSARAI